MVLALKMHQNNMFAADVFTTLTQPFGVRHHYMITHFVVWDGLFLVLVEKCVDLLGLLLLI